MGLTGQSPRQNRRRVGLALAILVTLGIGAGWWNRDPWPPRVVIPYPAAQGLMLAPRFSADGRLFLMSGPRGVEAWDVRTGRPSRPPNTPLILAPVIGFDRSPVLAHDRRSCAGIVEPSPQNQEVVWADASSGAIRARFSAGSSRVRHLAFDASDQTIRVLVIDADQSVVLVAWDLGSGRKTRQPVEGWVAPLGPSALSPDGLRLARVDSTRNGVQVWDQAAASPLDRWVDDPDFRLDPNVDPVFTADGQTLLVGRTDGAVDCADVVHLRWLPPLTPPAAAETLLDLAISHDGQILAVSRASRRSSTWADRAWTQLCRLIPGGQPSVRTNLTLSRISSGRILSQSRGSYAATFAPDDRSVATFETDETIAIRPIP